MPLSSPSMGFLGKLGVSWCPLCNSPVVRWRDPCFFRMPSLPGRLSFSQGLFPLASCDLVSGKGWSQVWPEPFCSQSCQGSEAMSGLRPGVGVGGRPSLTAVSRALSFALLQAWPIFLCNWPVSWRMVTHECPGLPTPPHPRTCRWVHEAQVSWESTRRPIPGLLCLADSNFGDLP